MKFKYRPVDMDFLERAPVRFVNEVELDASATDVFTIFEDAEAWPEWIKLIVKVEWTSPKPYGVGTTRIVKGSFLTVNEYFFVWQQNKRFAFYFTEASLPLFKAFAEDYRLENLGDNRCKFIYTVCLEPIFLMRLGGSLVLKFYDQLFQKVTKNLAEYIRCKNAQA
ncbi:SRPBCC family protein [Calothrix rhizosoleniae]|uniref:SRPBCC family protein n=1 Tax=Calothrix rhizosoleniae TaxID=888997 RepID=UPI000B49AAC6|nr:SRPBCC family protein [Calothrix rhizosoleniae]